MPLHERIRTDIEGQILSGALRPGDRVPIEHELMRTYNCSRMTVNKAVSALASVGLVERRKRLGTIVAPPRVHAMVLDIPDLPTEIKRRGDEYRWQLVSRSIRPALDSTPFERDLGGGQVLVLRGVHFASREPLAVEDRLISLAAVPDIAKASLEDEPPGTWLLRNVPWTEAETRIVALGADAGMAAALDAPIGLPCLSIERRTWRGGDPITQVVQSFPGTRYDLFARFGYRAP